MTASSWVLETVPLADVNEGLFPNHRTDLGAEDGSLDALVESVRTWGVLTPILLARTSQGMGVIAGHRRLHAARVVGLATIPAQIAPEGLAGEDWPLSAALVENLQRKGLNPIEEARGFAALQQRGWSQERIGLLVGKSQANVSRILALLRLPAAVVQLLERGALDSSHGIALLPLLSARVPADRICEIAQRAAIQGATSRQIEIAVGMELASRGVVPPRASVAPAAAGGEAAAKSAPRSPSSRSAPQPKQVEVVPCQDPGEELAELLQDLRSGLVRSDCPKCVVAYKRVRRALVLLARMREAHP